MRHSLTFRWSPDSLHSLTARQNCGGAPMVAGAGARRKPVWTAVRAAALRALAGELYRPVPRCEEAAVLPARRLGAARLRLLPKPTCAPCCPPPPPPGGSTQFHRPAFVNLRL